MSTLNAIFALIGGVGVYFLFTAILDAPIIPRKRSLFTSTDKPAKDRQKNLFEFLEIFLYQARAPISLSEFAATSFAIGVLVGVIFYFATRAGFVSLLMVFVGFFLYYAILVARRDTATREYEKVQTQVAFIAANAFQTVGLNLDAVLATIIKNGPELTREDWITVRAALSSGAGVDMKAISKVVSYRNSPGFWRLVEAILLYRDEPERLPAILVDQRVKIKAEVELARETAAALSAPQRQLFFVSLIPTLLLLVFSTITPQFRSFYSSFVGQIVMIGCFVYSAFVAYFAYNASNKAVHLRSHKPMVVESRGQVAFPGKARDMDGGAGLVQFDEDAVKDALAEMDLAPIGTDFEPLPDEEDDLRNKASDSTGLSLEDFSE